MHQQSQIDHTGAIIQRRRIQDKDQAAIAEEGQQVRQEAGPDGNNSDVAIGEKAGQAPFDAGGVGGADPEQFLGNHGQASLPREHQAKDEEGERFGTMPMHALEGVGAVALTTGERSKDAFIWRAFLSMRGFWVVLMVAKERFFLEPWPSLCSPG